MSTQMFPLFKRNNIRSVRDRYERQYGRDLDWNLACGRTPRETLGKLAALDLETCPAEAVNEAIGNDSWTAIRCDVCDASVEAAIVFTDHPTGDSHVTVCGRCLVLASREITPPTGEAK